MTVIIAEEIRLALLASRSTPTYCIDPANIKMLIKSAHIGPYPFS